MAELTPEQYSRIAGLGIVGAEGLEILRLLRVEGLTDSEAAWRMCMDVPQLLRRYEDATRRALEALETLTRTVGSAKAEERRYWQDHLDVMRGPGRSNPTSPPQVLDRYRSSPGKPVYSAGTLRERYPNVWDFVEP